MNLLLSCLFAVSLTSSEIDEFFTFRLQIPDAVESENEPGSDPSSGTGGWYVEGYTNAFTDFVAEYDYENFNILGIPIFSNGEWQFDHMIVSALWATSLTWEWDQIRIQGTGQELTIRNGLTIRADGYDYDVHGTYTREAYPSPDGTWKTKPSRLTPEVQSGVLSSFAGYCERQYFATQAQSNSWDEAQYGPTNSFKRFRFSPDEHTTVVITTNTSWTAETSCGYVDDVDMSYSRSFGWGLIPLHNKVAALLGGTRISSSPNYVSGSKDDETIVGSATLNFGVSTNEFRTNYTFVATRHTSATTQEYYYAGTEFNYHPTNRIVNTRRLVEAKNIGDLTDILLGVSWNGFINSASDRPGWFSSGDFWWSTTDDNFIGNDIIPDTAGVWLEDPTRDADWSECSQTLGTFKCDSVWYGNPMTMFPTYMMMMDMDFGQPPDLYDYSLTIPDTLYYDFPDLLTNTFTHADALGVTNETYRLRSERLCGINQAMSLMDRTYAVPVVTYPNILTNKHCKNLFLSRGSVRVSRIEQGYSPVVYIDSVTWEDIGLTNSVDYTSEMASEGSPMKFRVSNVGTSAHVTGGVIGGGDAKPNRDTVLRICERECVIGDFSLTMRNGGLSYGVLTVSAKASYDITTTNFYRQGTEVFFGIFGDDSDIWFSYDREYDIKRPHGSFGLGKTQPGFQSFDRVLSRKYGAILGSHARPIFRVGMQEPITWNRSDSVLGYKTDSDEYSSRENLLSQVEDMKDVFDDRFDHLFSLKYGFGPDSISSVAEIDMGDVEDVKSSVVVDSCTIDWTGKDGDWIDVDGSFENGILTISSLNSHVWDDTRSEYVIMPNYYCSLGSFGLIISYECDSPAQTNGCPFSMDAQLGIITQVDWDWKTMKRGDD